MARKLLPAVLSLRQRRHCTNSERAFMCYTVPRACYPVHLLPRALFFYLHIKFKKSSPKRLYFLKAHTGTAPNNPQIKKPSPATLFRVGAGKRHRFKRNDRASVGGSEARTNSRAAAAGRSDKGRARACTAGAGMTCKRRNSGRTGDALRRGSVGLPPERTATKL